MSPRRARPRPRPRWSGPPNGPPPGPKPGPPGPPGPHARVPSITSSSGKNMRLPPRCPWWQRPCGAAYMAPVMWCSFRLTYPTNITIYREHSSVKRSVSRAVSPARRRSRHRHAEEDRVDVGHRRALQVPAVLEAERGHEGREHGEIVGTVVGRQRQPRPLRAQRLGRSAQDLELGALDIDLDEVHARELTAGDQRIDRVRAHRHRRESAGVGADGTRRGAGRDAVVHHDLDAG